MTKLDSTIPASFADQAVFLELPRGGVSNIPEGKEFDALRQINDQFKVTPEDHKTELDMQVFEYNKEKGAFQSKNGTLQSRLDPAAFLRSRLAKKAEASEKHSTR